MSTTDRTARRRGSSHEAAKEHGFHAGFSKADGEIQNVGTTLFSSGRGLQNLY